MMHIFMHLFMHIPLEEKIKFMKHQSLQLSDIAERIIQKYSCISLVEMGGFLVLWEVD